MDPYNESTVPNTIRKIICLTLLGLCLKSFATEITLQNNLQGLSGQLLDNVQMRLSIKQKAIPKLTPETITKLYQKAPRQITKALEPFGYFKPEIQSHLTHRNNNWYATYIIRLGTPIIIKKIDFQVQGPGAFDQKFMALVNQVPLKINTPLETEKYQAAKKFLFDTASNCGYLKAYLSKKEIAIDLEKYSATITLQLNTGGKFFFGPVIFSRSPFADSFLQRYAPFKLGEVYSDAKLQAFQEALNNSDYFNQVTIIPKIVNNPNQLVPIVAELTPRRAHQYNFGAGYGTDTGARGSVGVDLRYLTPNGQHFKGFIRASQTQNSLEAHYLIPGHNPPTQQYDLSAVYQNLDQSYGKSDTGQVALAYLTNISNWQQTIKLSLMHERYQLTNFPRENTTLIVPSINWLHKKADDLIQPTTGHSINIFIQGSSETLLAKTDFIQSQVDAKYLTFLTKKIQLVLHGIWGYTTTDNFQLIPLSMQFFTGGAQSVRGYGYNDIGPGKNLIVGSAELRHQIYGDWFIAGFVDVGNASDQLLAGLKRDVGLGVVWRTAIGTLELSAAEALSIPGHPWKIQFSMGPEL